MEEPGMPKQGEFCWSELVTNNLETSREFYKNVFGWRMDPSKNAGEGFEYQEFQLGDEYPMGGMYDMKDIFPADALPPPHWVNYIAVDDVDAAAERVVELGGKCCQPPKDIPNVGRMMTIIDPTGAMVVLITLKQM
jgi:uncharacterized protein